MSDEQAKTPRAPDMSGVLMFGNGAKYTPTELRAAVESRFRYQQWSPEKVERGKAVTDAFVDAAVAVIQNVPPCPTRTRVINELETARMMANAAITHEGKF